MHLRMELGRRTGRTALSTRRRTRIAWVGALVCLVGLPAVVSAANPVLVSAASRRSHGSATYDIPLTLSGSPAVECRVSSGTLSMVLNFDQPITGGSAAVTGGTGVAGVAAVSGSSLTVPVTGVTDVQLLTLTASNITTADGGNLPSVAVSLRILEGDVNGNGFITSGDLNAIKSASAAAIVDGFTFRCDVNCNGSITSSDITYVKNKVATSGTVPGGLANDTPPTLSDTQDRQGVIGTTLSPVAFAVGDAESPLTQLGVRASSNNATLVAADGLVLGGSGANRTLTITPASGQTGSATITIEVGDGMNIVSDTFVLKVTPPPTLYTAYIRPQGTSATPGSGFATLLVSGDGTRAELQATYSNLTTPEVAKHIHGPASPSQSAGIIFDIDTAQYDEPTQTWIWNIAPVGTMSVADINQAINDGLTYINVHSSKYPNGEIRGQFLKASGSQTFVPPPAPPALPGGLPTAQDAARFLHQATFGPTAEEIAAVQAQGFDAWLNAQFAMPLHRLVTQPANNSFETPAVASGATVANPTNASWLFEGTSGITANSSIYTKPVGTNLAINSPQLNQSAYLLGTGKIRQTTNFAQAGRYRMSFLAAPRTNAGSPQTLVAKVDGTVVGTYPLVVSLPSSDPGRYNGFLTDEFVLTAGDHELSIEGTATGVDDVAMVDDVRVALASSMYGMVRPRLANVSNSINSAARNIETWWHNATTAPDQLRQRVAFALAQIFVVSAVDGTIDNRPLGLGDWHDMLADNAFGNFRQLLEEVTLHPDMGQYLNMRGNTKPKSPLFTAPNENYGREILQLFSIGLNQLQPDGTLKLGANGRPIPTYDQSVIQGFAHVFTGWDQVAQANAVRTPILRNVNLSDGSQVQRIQNYFDYYSKDMVVTAANHSNNSKLLLDGLVIPARSTQTVATSNDELRIALDSIFNHPNVGPFICRQLIQRLVTSNPSPGYVYRVAQVFANDGSGVRGNMRSVIRAILTDYEARSTDVLANQGYGHLREPVVRVASVIRAFHPTSVSGLYKINNTDTQLGQTPYRPPTVFNFFEPYYVHPGQLADVGLYAPEFQISTEIMAINIPNFMQVGVYRASAGTLATFQGGDIRLDLTTEQNLAGDPAALVDRLNLLMMSGQMTDAMRTKVINAVSAMAGATAANRLVRARFAVYLVATSPQCAVQR